METRRWEGARLGSLFFGVEVGAMGMLDVDGEVGSTRLALLSLPLPFPLLFSCGCLIWLRVEVEFTVAADLKLFHVLMNVVLLGMPEGVGSRDRWCPDAREPDCGRLLVVRRLLKALEASLLSASVNEVLRRGVRSGDLGSSCDCCCTFAGIAASVGCSALAMAC